MALNTPNPVSLAAIATATTDAAIGPAEARLQHGSAAGSDPAVAAPPGHDPGAFAALVVLVPHPQIVDNQTSVATATSHALLTDRRAEPRGQSPSLQQRMPGTATSLVQDAASKTFAGSVSAKSVP